MGIRWRSLALGTAVTGSVLLSGCGQNPAPGNGVASISTSNAPSSSAAANAAKTDQDKAREFAKCMRAHGVNMPDPKVDGGKIQVQIHGGKADKGKIDAANQACKDLMPGGGGPKGPVSAEDLDRARAMAKCLREHGVNVPDPTANDPGIKVEGHGPDDKSKMDTAMRACDPNFGKGDTSTDSGGGNPADTGSGFSTSGDGE